MICVRNFGWAWLTLIALGLITAVGSLASYPPNTALASNQVSANLSPGRGDPTTIVMEYVDGVRADTLLQLDDFVWVKASNYRGIEVDGQIYYYQISPHTSFDPLSRGAVDEHSVRVWQVITDAEFTVVIYTIDDEPVRPHSFSARLTREPRARPVVCMAPVLARAGGPGEPGGRLVGMVVHSSSVMATPPW